MLYITAQSPLARQAYVTTYLTTSSCLASTSYQLTLPVSQSPVMPPLTFLPVMVPLPCPKAGRIAELENRLKTETLVPEAVENILAIIKMYETGELPKPIGKLSFIQGGKILPSLKDIDPKRPFNCEVRLGPRTRQGLVCKCNAILLNLVTGYRYATVYAIDATTCKDTCLAN